MGADGAADGVGCGPCQPSGPSLADALSTGFANQRRTMNPLADPRAVYNAVMAFIPPRRPAHRAGVVTTLCLGVAALLAGPGLVAQPATAPAPDAASPPPAAERWSETAYGLSVPVPSGTREIEQPLDGSVVNWVHPAGWTISFDLAYSDRPVSLEDMAQQALVEMGFSRATPRLIRDAPPPEGAQPPEPPQPPATPQAPPTSPLENPEGPQASQPSDAQQPQRRLGNRPSVTLFFEVDEEREPDWFYGQAIVMLEPYAAAVFKVSSEQEQADAARAAFEAMLHEMHIPAVFELEEIRKARVEAGEAWLSQVTPDDLVAVLPADQHLRMIQHGEDVGYMRIQAITDSPELGRGGLQAPGTLVKVDLRHYLNNRAVDTRAQMYASADGRSELWSTKSTLRADLTSAGEGVKTQLPSRDPGRPPTWVETGMRDGPVLTVITETPAASEIVEQIENHERFAGTRAKGNVSGSVDESNWATPETAYLSQVLVHALPALLPAEEAVYCFYAYHPQSGKLGLRTVRVVPNEHGGVTIFDRPTPRRGETRSTYDRDRRLIEQVFPGGLTLKPTTPQELQTLWKDR